MVFSRINDGSQVYFLGQESDQSFWYFYPISFLMKTPISTLILFIFSTLYFTIDIFNNIKKNKVVWFISKNFLEIISVFIIISFFIVGIISNINIGLRHILVIYPFIFILIAKRILVLFKKYSNELDILKTIIILSIVVYYVFTNLHSYPSYLAYFNEFIGRNNAYKYTVDSNLDWGQDLRRLAFYVEKNDIKNIKVDFFGAPPLAVEYYLKERQEVWRAKMGKTTGWLAVSATYFQSNKYYPTKNSNEDYSWLHKYEPEEIIGGSILVFNIDK